MGVTGLWRLLEPSGRPQPLDSLRGRVLAVDISIWLHQMVKGYQDATGGAVPNAHLLGLFQRLCKLLYYGIKPIFVFDGSVPALKRNTISNRQKRRSNMRKDADKIQQQLMEIIAKHAAVNTAIPNQSSPTKKSPTKTINTDEDLFKLPALAEAEEESESEEESNQNIPLKYQNADLHSIDVDSADFKKLAARERHDILIEMKETRKQNSWGRLNEIPGESNNFSDYQMRRLLKRRQVQVSLEETEKEIGGNTLSINELELLLNQEGIDTKIESIPTRQIASNENSRFVLIKDVKKAISDAIELENAKKEESSSETKEEIKPVAETSKKEESTAVSTELDASDDMDDDLKLAIAMSLECDNSEPSNEDTETVKDITPDFTLELIKEECIDSDDDEIEDVPVQNVNKMTIARSYMMEFSGLTENEINSIINREVNTNKIEKKPEINRIETVDDKSVDSEPKIIELDSDSDDTFEEVPDSEPTMKDDIFADVFEDASKIKLLDEALISTLNKKVKHPVEDAVDLTIESPAKIKEKPVEVVQAESTVKNNLEATSSVVNIDEVDLEEPPKSPMESVNVEDSQTSEVTKTSLPIKDVVALAEELDSQRSALEKERNKLDRMGRNISEEMTKDAQELLKLFGIPYIVAPTEAESQCAYLESIKLTDGTITDDSDIWLFGGKTVYRNFFNQQKQVLKFLSENIRSSFKLQREDLILLALLVGSDYTMGITGIGPVTALEILAAFPTNKNDVTPPFTNLLNGLNRFKTWWLTKQVATYTSLRNKLKNIDLSQEFPSHKVVEAYLLPEVDKSKERFTWGKMDLVGLREYAREKFGWSRTKTEEILNPVVKRMDIKLSQLTIQSYFNTEYKHDSTQDKMSKRVKRAIENLDNDKAELNKQEESTKGEPKKGRKRRKTSKNIKADVEMPSTSNSEGTDASESIKTTTEDDFIKSLIHSQEESPFFNKRHNEIIPQREFDKGVLLKNKLKAIELFRKSKMGPGFVQKRKRQIRVPKEDAELSESSSD